MDALLNTRIVRTALAATLLSGLVCGSVRFARAQSSAQESAKSQEQDKQNSTPASKDDSNSKKDGKSDEHATADIRITVTSNTGKPIENASVYVRIPEDGGLFHHDKLQELDLKTNLDGTVKVPPVPQGKVLIQVVAKGWKTYGRWYELNAGKQEVAIKLDPPPRWY